MSDDTFKSTSILGQRLKKYKRVKELELAFKGKFYKIATKITIGREKSNNIIIDDNLASRFHAFIQKIKDEYFIKDMASTNGTFVNNEKVPPNKYIKLKKDDILQIGRTELLIK
jgi:pSer/pThr/pTyr-binding forkhead associated (FHA) protein